MSVFQILSLLGVPGVIVLILTTYINRSFKKRDEENEKIWKEEERKRMEVKAQTEKVEAQNKATMLGVQALLRDRLISAIKHCISQGYAEYHERENIKNMYVNYEALGPNSVMDDMYEQFTELPIQKE